MAHGLCVCHLCIRSKILSDEGVDIRGWSVELHITGLRITIIPGHPRLRKREFGNEMSGKFPTSGLFGWTEGPGMWVVFSM